MFGKEQHVLPRLGEFTGRIVAFGRKHAPENFGTGQTGGALAVHRRFAGRRGGAVLPRRGHVAPVGGQVFAVLLFECRKEFLGRRDAELRRIVTLVPRADHVGHQLVGRSVVAVDRVAQITGVIGKFVGLQLLQVVPDRLHPAHRKASGQPAVEPRIAASGLPHQHLVGSRLRLPVEGPVAPFDVQGRGAVVADLSVERHVIGTRRVGLNAVFCHGGGQSADLSGNVAHHRRIHLHADFTGKPVRVVEHVHQLLLTADARQDTAQRGVDVDYAVAYGLNQPCGLVGSGIGFEIPGDRPRRFGIPAVTGAFGIILRPLGEVHRTLQIAPLELHHVHLTVRVADVLMRMGEEIDGPFAGGRHLETLFDGSLTARQTHVELRRLLHVSRREKAVITHDADARRCDFGAPRTAAAFEREVGPGIYRIVEAQGEFARRSFGRFQIALRSRERQLRNGSQRAHVGALLRIETDFGQPVIIGILVHVGRFAHDDRIVAVVVVALAAGSCRKTDIAGFQARCVQDKVGRFGIAPHRLRNDVVVEPSVGQQLPGLAVGRILDIYFVQPAAGVFVLVMIPYADLVDLTGGGILIAHLTEEPHYPFARRGAVTHRSGRSLRHPHAMPQIVGFVQVAPHAGAVDRSRGRRTPERRTGRCRNLIGG